MDIYQAVDILGKKRVISAGTVTGIWNRIISERRTERFSIPLSVNGNLGVPFSKADLTALREEGNWLLIYNPGLSLVESFSILGSTCSLKPYFGKGASKWLSTEREEWAVRGVKSGYNLVKVEVLFRKKSVKEQETLIAQKDRRFARVSAQMLVNAYVSCWGVWGNSSLDNYSHFGIERDENCMQIVLTFCKGSICISQWPASGKAIGIGAYICFLT